MGKESVFRSVSGSTQDPGIFETIFMGRQVSAYTVFTVPHDRQFVLEYVSAVVTRVNQPYPADNTNDFGAVGFKLAGANNFHFIPFARSEPFGILIASQLLQLYVPANAQVIVKVPLVPNQSGGAEININGYYNK